jgi:hypothetical protein
LRYLFIFPPSISACDYIAHYHWKFLRYEKTSPKTKKKFLKSFWNKQGNLLLFIQNFFFLQNIYISFFHRRGDMLSICFCFLFLTTFCLVKLQKVSKLRIFFFFASLKFILLKHFWYDSLFGLRASLKQFDWFIWSHDNAKAIVNDRRITSSMSLRKRSLT